MTKIQNCALQFDKKTASIKFQSELRFGSSLQITLEPNAWVDPPKKLYNVDFTPIFVA